jgi:hypothetical protein
MRLRLRFESLLHAIDLMKDWMFIPVIYWIIGIDIWLLFLLFCELFVKLQREAIFDACM